MISRLLIAFALTTTIPVLDLKPVAETEPTGRDADDPAIWIHPKDSGRSLILGTNKTPAPEGALVVFGLDGKMRQRIDGIDRPNNVDVKQGIAPGVDIAVLTERLNSRLRVFRVTEAGVTDLAAIPVFEGEEGQRAAPMGIALYTRPRDSAVFAIVGRKTGPTEGYLWQYRLEWTGNTIRARKVREFGAFSGGDGEIEAIAVDDELGYVYYADEECCIRKWHADPDHLQAAREVATFGHTGFAGNREGIGIYAGPKGAGFIVCTDQIPGGSEFKLFRRSGDQSEPVAILRGGSDSTDGIEVTRARLGPDFPHGLLVAMNSSGRNFLLYRWPESLK